MLRVLLLITLGMGALARVAAAEPVTATAAVAEPCAEEAAVLRADLEHESRRAEHWVLAWRIVYTAATIGELGLAASGTGSAEDRQGYWVGGAKSSLAALGFWFAPLRIHVPPPSGDACIDRSMLRNTAERVASDERAAFWVAHVGGLIINVGGALLLAETASWRTGLLSFATGYPVALLSNYTMPRTSWGRVRESTWTASVTSGPGRWGLAVAGSF